MTEFCALTAKAYACKLDDNTEMRKAKGTKKCIERSHLKIMQMLCSMIK